MGQIIRKEQYGIIGNDDPDDEIEVAYCPRCPEQTNKSLLRNRILKPNEPVPRDYDSWRQCHFCGLIIPIYEAKKESKLKDFVETSSNPFDQGKAIVGLGNKIKKTSLQKQRQKLKDRIEQEKDKDIQAELRKGNTVTIIE